MNSHFSYRQWSIGHVNGLEGCLTTTRKHESLRKEMIYNLNSGHLLMWICRGLEIVGYYYIRLIRPIDCLKIYQFGKLSDCLHCLGFCFTVP